MVRFCGREGADVTKDPGHYVDNEKHCSVRGHVAFVDTFTVVHLGDVTPHETEHAPYFLVFDKKNSHRVIDELQKGGNSIYADQYDSTGVNLIVRNVANGLGVLSLLCFNGGCCTRQGSPDEHEFEVETLP